MHQGRLQAHDQFTSLLAFLPTTDWFFLICLKFHQRFPFQQDGQSALSFMGCGESGSQPNPNPH